MKKKIIYVIAIVIILIIIGYYFQEEKKEKIFKNFFEEENYDGSIVLYDLNNKEYYFHNKKRCEKKFPAGSSWYIINAISAHEKGVVENEKEIFNNSYLKEENSTYKEISLKDYVNKSVSWVNLILLKKITVNDINDNIKSTGFGKLNLKTKEELLNPKSILLSQNDVLGFLMDLYNNNLPISNKSIIIAKKILLLKDLPEEKIYCISSNQKLTDSLYYSWHSGWIEANNNVYFFSINTESNLLSVNDNPAIDIAWKIKKAIGLIKEEQEKQTEIEIPEVGLDTMIGQMLITGFSGKSLDTNSSIYDVLKKNLVGGVILYDYNIENGESGSQLRNLIEDLKSLTYLPLLVSIDQEGGKVIRLKHKDGFPKTVTAESLGKDDDLKKTKYYSEVIASTLANVGIDMNFGPVVDLKRNAKNPIIAKFGRSFSEDPVIATNHAIEFIRSHHKFGVLTAIKHFPGHGSSAFDSHNGMVDVTDSWSPVELEPFQNIIDSGYCDAIMTAHIINTNLEAKGLPSTLSYDIMTKLLRDSMNYDGVIFSDDMQMESITKFYGEWNSIRTSINSGVDVLMYCGVSVEKVRKIHRVIKHLVKKGDISEERIRESYKRIMTLKNRMKNNKEIINI